MHCKEKMPDRARAFLCVLCVLCGHFLPQAAQLRAPLFPTLRYAVRMSDAPTDLHTGRFLRLRIREGWEYVDRPTAEGLVGIIPVTDAGEIIFIEQYRPPVQARVIELPAGASGDAAALRGESLLAAAQRELEEEAGYRARTWREVARGCTSPGLTEEVMTWYLATGLERIGAGGGDEHEAIDVHPVPLANAVQWLKGREQAGCLIDLKVWMALWFAERAAVG